MFEPGKTIKKLIDEEGPKFECILLGLAATVKPFFDMYCVNKICCHHDNHRDFSGDFETPIGNALYLCIRAHNRMQGNPEDFEPVDVNNLDVLLSAEDITRFVMLSPTDHEEVKQLYLYVRSITSLQSLPDVCLGIPYWLQKKRIQGVLSITGTLDWKPEAVAEQIEKIRNFAKEQIKDTNYAFGEGFMNAKAETERFPTAIGTLDQVLCGGHGSTGGFGRGEHALFIAPSGCGKTVMACQLASTWASIGKRGLLISTEQRHDELEPRIVAAQAKIPFRVISDGIVFDKLTEAQKKKLMEVHRNLKDRLFIENWQDDTTRSIRTDLEALYKKVSNKAGADLDFIILDWIGGALGDGHSDPGAKRLVFQDTAKFMADIAVRLNIVTVSFAQATHDAENKQTIKPAHIAECKSLHNNANWAFGITALREDDTSEGPGVLKNDQFLSMLKGRKAQIQRVRILRNFEYQRFESR